MFKINKKLLPIKAHYFFFMAAMGPILPQINVYGRQLGISPDVMGLITSVLPLMYILAKPAVGFLADYFSSLRKAIFMFIIIVMTLCYAGFYFVPHPRPHLVTEKSFYILNYNGTLIKTCDNLIINDHLLCTTHRKAQCHLHGRNESLDILMTMNLFNDNDNNHRYDICILPLLNNSTLFVKDGHMNCSIVDDDKPNCLKPATFWTFVILMCLGTIGFNVANCISDAVCFDMLGESGNMKYGKQRVWGTIGFGLAALISGFAVNYSSDDETKSFLPAILIMLLFSIFDIGSIVKLKLPVLYSSESIFNEVGTLLKQKGVAIFLMFATLAGIFDSFIIYYMFWHLEDLAVETGHEQSIKMIEGLVVAAECLVGEIVFFMISGKILKKIGYIHCLSFCFFMYSLRLGLISIIPNPWYLIPIELVMQGATYALCYTCIVAYAAAIAPPGTSATIQGLVAGMDDGVGFAIGSLIGGQMYRRLGGATSFKIFALGAFITSILHVILRPHPRKNPDDNTLNKEMYEIPPEQNTIGLVT